jgi:hypothetical protein
LARAKTLRVLLPCIAGMSLMSGCATQAPPVHRSAIADGVTADQLRARLHDATAAGEHAYAAQSLLTLIERFPDALAAVPDEDVQRAVSGASDAAAGQITAPMLLDGLFKVHWKPTDGVEPSDYWLALAQARLQEQDLTGARAAASRITNPRELIIMQADKRFDAIVDRDPVGAGMARSAQLQVQLLRAAAVRQPRSLRVVLKLAHALEIEGDYAEAVKLTALAAEADMDASQHGRHAYDEESQLPWVLDTLANALWAKGEFDRAMQVMRTGSRLPEDGYYPNGSQQVNRADMFCSLGEPDKAADVIDELHETHAVLSPYGTLAVHDVYLRIALLKADHARVSDELNYLREHQSIGRRAVASAFVMAGALDDANAWLRSNLANPSTRDQALAFVQSTRDGELTPVEQQHEALKRAWVNSPQVQAEVAKWGRINTYHVMDIPL